LSPFALLTTQAITWIKVEKPTFDLVGLVLGSIGLAATLAGLALLVGAFLGFALIRRNRSHAGQPFGPGTLHLDLRG
jgi:hypothetical protein